MTTVLVRVHIRTPVVEERTRIDTRQCHPNFQEFAHHQIYTADIPRGSLDRERQRPTPIILPSRALSQHVMHGRNQIPPVM